MKNLIFTSIFFITSCGFGKGIGFGVGQTLGEHLLMPSLFTMRIQLTQSLLVAPEVDFRYSTSDEAVDSIKGSTYAIGIESNFYYSVVKRERTSLFAIVGIGLEFSKETSEWYEHEWYPDTSTIEVKSTTSESSQGLNFGLGLEQSLTDNLSILISSLSNMMITKLKQEEERGGDRQTLQDTRDFILDFQNLKCCIYLVWYL